MGGRRYLSVLVVCALVAAAALGGIARAAITRASTSRAAAPAGSVTALHGPGACLGGPGCAPLRGVHGTGVLELSVSPDGATLYLAAGGGVAVAARGADGRLIQLAGAAGCLRGDGADGCTRVPGLHDAGRISVTPDGTSAYLATAHGLLAFSRDAMSGALTPLTGTSGCIELPGAGCARLHGVTSTHDPQVADTLVVSNTALYLAGGRDAAQIGVLAVLSRDPATGALHQRPGTAGCVSGGHTHGCTYSRCLDSEQSLTLSDGGATLVDGSTDSLDDEATGSGAIASFRVDPVTGDLAALGCANPPDAVSGVLSIPGSADVLASTLYGNRGTGRVGTTVLRVAPRADGHLAPVAKLGSCTAGHCGARIGAGTELQALTPDGHTLYLADFDDRVTAARVTAYHVTALPGAFSCISDAKQFGRPRPCTYLRAGAIGGDLAIAPDGGDLYASIERVTPNSTRLLGVRAFAITP
jgi:hypothetical protein